MSAHSNPKASLDSSATQFAGAHLPSHTLLLYREDSFPSLRISQFIADALESGDSAIIIGTREHRDGIAEHLYRRGLDIGEFLQGGSYLEMDADELLSRVLVDGIPNRVCFMDFVEDLAANANKASKIGRHVTIFEEMASLLRRPGCHEMASFHLEQLWSEFATSRSVSLYCGYSLESFPRRGDEEAFEKICDLHTKVLPMETYPLNAGSGERLRSIAALQQKALALETETVLGRYDARFRELVDAVQDYGIFVLNREGNVATWNSGACRILGFEECEILGGQFSCFFTDEDALSGRPAQLLQKAASDGRIEDQSWRLRKGGRKFFASTIITAIRKEDGALDAYAVVMRDLTEATTAQTALEEAEDSMHDSDTSLGRFSLLVMLRQEEERRRVGSELIDSLGQYLAVLKMRLDSLQNSADRRELQGEEDLAQCVKLVEDSIQEARSVSYLLYPPLLEETGLKFVIPWYLDGFTRRSGIQTTFKISPDVTRLTNDANEALFRVLQEALSNIQRHSGSRTAEIQLLTKGESVVLIVSDAGKGIPPEYLRGNRNGVIPEGVGIRGMRERLRYLGGRLEITSSEKGATITASIPVTRCAVAAASA